MKFDKEYFTTINYTDYLDRYDRYEKLAIDVTDLLSKISLLDITKGIWPMLAMYFAVLISFILFPQIVTVPMEWLSK